MKEVCPIEICTGCSACFAACNSCAITMVDDQYGFTYPHIDQDKCVDCGLCAKSCPNNTPPLRSKSPECYVGHATDQTEQLTSTSGGIASAISRYVIRQGGVVYGCCARPGVIIEHIRVDKEEDLELLKGSKYVQSDMGATFQAVKSDLKTNTLVCFIGTPCQVAGLKTFLRKEYDNLITVDFVCHGVPSRQYLKSSFDGVDVSRLVPAFRKKEKKAKDVGYNSIYGTFLKDDKGNFVYDQRYPKGLFLGGFINALFYRNSCYQCKYTTPERVSDFTLGDYHDSEHTYVKLSGHSRILSMMMANTDKAKNLLTKLCGIIEYDNCSLETMLIKHDQLHKPMPRHRNYNLFRESYLKYGFNKAVKIALREEISNYRKGIIKDFIKRIPGVVLINNILHKR